MSRRMPCPHPLGKRLFREHLTHVRKGLEFERIAGRIVKEHGGLLTYLALKADVRLDLKVHAMLPQAVGELLPSFHRQDNTEVRYWHGMAIHRIMVRGVRSRRQMRDDLMAEEVEVDPLVSGASFGAAESLAIEGASGVEVIDRKGNVEGREGGGHPSILVQPGYALTGSPLTGRRMANSVSPGLELK